jgi:hypothetical protein
VFVICRVHYSLLRSALSTAKDKNRQKRIITTSSLESLSFLFYLLYRSLCLPLSPFLLAIFFSRGPSIFLLPSHSHFMTLRFLLIIESFFLPPSPSHISHSYTHPSLRHSSFTPKPLSHSYTPPSLLHS